jgi:hypothetical protein
MRKLRESELGGGAPLSSRAYILLWARRCDREVGEVVAAEGYLLFYERA